MPALPLMEPPLPVVPAAPAALVPAVPVVPALPVFDDPPVPVLLSPSGDAQAPLIAAAATTTRSANATDRLPEVGERGAAGIRTIVFSLANGGGHVGYTWACYVRVHRRANPAHAGSRQFPTAGKVIFS